MKHTARPVKFSSRLRILFKRPIPLFIGGIGFFMGGFILVMGLFIHFILKEPGIPEVNYSKINKYGNMTEGTITGIQVQKNITINNEHPVIVNYTYTKEGKQVNSVTRTLNLYRAGEMSKGDPIEVKYLENDSIIVGLEPVTFPVWIFLIISLPFVLAGIICWGYAFFKLFKIVRLYTRGELKEATLMSVSAGTKFSLVMGANGMICYQYYTTQNKLVVANSLIEDYLLYKNKNMGDTVKILVSLRNQNNSCPIPYTEAVRNHWEIA